MVQRDGMHIGPLLRRWQAQRLGAACRTNQLRAPSGWKENRRLRISLQSNVSPPPMYAAMESPRSPVSENPRRRFTAVSVSRISRPSPHQVLTQKIVRAGPQAVAPADAG